MLSQPIGYSELHDMVQCLESAIASCGHRPPPPEMIREDALMLRRFTPWSGQRLRLKASSLPPDRLGIVVLVLIGAFHLTAVLLSHPAPAYLAPRFTLTIALAFVGLIVIATMSLSLLATLLVAVPTIHLGTARAAGIEFDPTFFFGATLSIGLFVRLFSEQVVSRRAWTSTGVLSLWTIIAATSAVIFSSIANGQSLSNSMPWFVAANIALVLFLSARRGYLEPSAIPVALLAGFAITATSDLRLYLRGTVEDTGINAGRFVGGLGDYELLGEYYAVAIVIALATLIHARRLAASVLALYVIGLGLILLFATHSRSPVLLLAVACPLLLVVPAIGRTASRPRLVLIIGLTASLAMVLAPLVSSSNTFTRLLAIVDRGDFVATINRSSVWPIVVSDPKFLSSGLFGNGPAGVYEWFGVWPHNLVLWTIWSLGILGCIFVALLVATAISGIIHWRKSGWLTVALSFSLIVLIADQLVVEFPREGSMILFVLPLCALAGATSIAEMSEPLDHAAQ